jgi:hypothetical protein
MNARRIGPSPDKIIVELDERGTRRVIERVRTKPLSEAELWAPIQKYFPAELRAAAASCLLEMNKATAAKPTARKRERGRPAKGIGAEVDALMCGPFQADQDTARRLVAARLWQKGKKRKALIEPSRTKISAHDAESDASFTKIFNEVAKLHRQWRQKQRKRPAPVA